MSSNEPMKKFRVFCYRNFRGFYDVKAKSEEEAETKANEHLWNRKEMDGIIDEDTAIAEMEELKS